MSLILVVDDEEMVGRMVRDVLTREGHEVILTRDVATAREAMARHKPDLILSDIRMPGSTGVDLLKAARQLLPETPVILMTGYPEVETVQAALREGAFDYLVKPVLPREMGRVVNRALEHRRLRLEREGWRNRLEAVFRSVGEAILTLDDAWHVVQCNDAAHELLGLTPDARESSLEEVAPWLFGGVRKVLEEARDQQVKNRTRLTVTLPDGSERVLGCSAAPFHDPVWDKDGAVLVLRDESRLASLEKEHKARRGLGALVGSSAAMQEVYTLISQIAPVDSTALITGETGTGKELAARALHDLSPRSGKPFVALNCSAIPAGLLESELFGHVRGAFTHAVQDKPGRFRLADHGTIFLDEIGDMPPETQVRLLRVLQERVVEPVGDSRSVKVDVRVIAATHRDLRERVKAGTFREDLFYRLKVLELRMPPLRERLADIPVLAGHFLKLFNDRFGKAVQGVDQEAMALLLTHDWPGNVRELEHVLEHAMVMARLDTIGADNLPAEVRSSASGHPLSAAVEALVRVESPPCAPSALPAVPHGEMDREALLRVLGECRWQIKEAARRLGVSRTTLWRRMRALGLNEGNEA